MDFLRYSLDEYKADLKSNGLEKTWEKILNIRMKFSDSNVSDIIKTRNFGELYETGLAYTNKITKKEMGKYYTPEDVSYLLSDFFNDLKGDRICDVCCGVGNLILAYLKYIGKENARKIILSDLLYLYDIDKIALKICKYSIAFEYGMDCLNHIHGVHGDFMSKKIRLPENCKVISNPPYFKITSFKSNWEITDVIKTSKDLYSAFMEKIIKNSLTSVIITPFSFIGSDKFYSLRKVLNDYNGMIFSFDNVPANIFNGKKHGIFNTNCTNSVRATITVVENKQDIKGFRVSPLIRFQTSEREDLLKKDSLMSLLPEMYLTVSDTRSKYPKCFKQLYDVYNSWVSTADGKFEDLLSNTKTDYSLSVPTTCRYFLSATKKELNRDGKNIFYFKDLKSYEYAYCILNSSFAYWHWRLFDGGITYPTGLLKTMPIRLNHDCNMHDIVQNAQSHETDFLVYKKNALNIQENVKFPLEYRDAFNQTIMQIFNIHADIRIFDCIHKNNIF